MIKTVLIAIIVLFVGFVAAVLALRNQNISPAKPFYTLKLAGEWLDVNFLVFGAPEKQAKHLELAERRLHEVLTVEEQALRPELAARLKRYYETELARAEYMAEHLALLDHRFIVNIEQVYEVTLHHLEHAWENGGQAYIHEFASAAVRYNEKSIKVLLQKHQHNRQYTEYYQRLIERKLELEEKFARGDSQKQKLQQAKKVLTEGRELEWAYDLTQNP